RTSIVSWPGVIAAGAIAIGLLFLVTSLWNALAFSSQVSWFHDHIDWLNAITAAVVLLIGGFLAGWLARRGFLAGGINGLTVWGVLVTGAVVFGVGSALPFTQLSNAGRNVNDAQPGSFWPTFVAYGVGLVVAVFGGFIGALVAPKRFARDRYDADRDDVDL